MYHMIEKIALSQHSSILQCVYYKERPILNVAHYYCKISTICPVMNSCICDVMGCARVGRKLVKKLLCQALSVHSRQFKPTSMQNIPEVKMYSFIFSSKQLLHCLIP